MPPHGWQQQATAAWRSFYDTVSGNRGHHHSAHRAHAHGHGHNSYATHRRRPYRSVWAAMGGRYHGMSKYGSSFSSTEDFDEAHFNGAPWYIVYRNTKDLRLTLYSVIYMIVCVFVVCLANSVSDRRNTNNFVPPDSRQRLPDFLMNNTHPGFAHSGLPPDLSDRLLIGSAVMLFVRVLTLGTYTMTGVRRTFYVMGTIYLLRAMCTTMTVLPNPLTTCETQIEENLLVDALRLFLGQRSSCGDVFFSGHTIIYTMPFLVWYTFTTNPWLHAVTFLVGMQALFAYFSLIASAYHYTIDVAVAILLTTLIWTLFHWSVTLRELRRTNGFCRWLSSLDNVGVNSNSPSSSSSTTSAAGAGAGGAISIGYSARNSIAEPATSNAGVFETSRNGHATSRRNMHNNDESPPASPMSDLETVSILRDRDDNFNASDYTDIAPQDLGPSVLPRHHVV